MSGNAISPSHETSATVTGTAAVAGSLIAQTVGAALAKELFPLVGANGVTGLRVVLAAAFLLVVRRPWRRRPARDVLPALLAYGVMLGLMNLLIYQAIARLPIGIATGIEVLGPLSVVLWTSHSTRDLVWLTVAVTGLVLLLPLRADAAIDPVGVVFAMGAAVCWAFYIVYGRRVSGPLGGTAVAWGMLVAAVMVLPICAATSGRALPGSHILVMGLLVALLSSALPYTLEMEAMRRLPARAFGTLLSTAPAVAALSGFIVLGEVLSATQWLAILLIMIASAASALEGPLPLAPSNKRSRWNSFRKR